MNSKKITTFLLSVSFLTLAGCSFSGTDTPNTTSFSSRLMNANIDYSNLVIPANQNGSMGINGNSNMTWDMPNVNQDNNQNINASATPSVNENQNTPATPEPIPSNPAKAALTLPANPDLIAPHETPFDCGLPKNFAKRTWYDSFIASLESLQRYSPQEVASLLKSAKDKTETAKKIQVQTETRDNLTILCVAKDESLIVSLVAGDKDRSGFKIVRYFPFRDLIDVALRSDAFQTESWTVVPNQVGKRVGSLLQLKGSGASFSYDYVKNTLQMDK